VAVAAAVAILVLLAAVVLIAEDVGLGLVVVALLAGSAFLARYALRRDAAALKAQAVPGTPVGPAGRPHHEPEVGWRKAERFSPWSTSATGVVSSPWCSSAVTTCSNWPSAPSTVAPT